MGRSTPEKDEPSAFERSYRMALASHVDATKGADAGGGIGRRAVRSGFGTSATARMHDRIAAKLCSVTVRQFAWELRPTLPDDLELVPALRSYVKSFGRRTGLEVRSTVAVKSFPTTRDRQAGRFRIARRALSDVGLRAQPVRVSPALLPGVVRLEVTDDGRSSDVRRIENSTKDKRLGLLVLRGRGDGRPLPCDPVVARARHEGACRYPAGGRAR